MTLVVNKINLKENMHYLLIEYGMSNKILYAPAYNSFGIGPYLFIGYNLNTKFRFGFAIGGFVDINFLLWENKNFYYDNKTQHYVEDHYGIINVNLPYGNGSSFSNELITQFYFGINIRFLFVYYKELNK